MNMNVPEGEIRIEAKVRRGDRTEAEQRVADRDAAWERAVRLHYDQTFGLDADGFIVVIRRWLDAEQGRG